jgi:formylglycine-generating enzyme
MSKQNQSTVTLRSAGIASAPLPEAKRLRQILLWVAAFVLLPAFLGAAVTWAIGTHTKASEIRAVYGDGTRGPLGKR